MRLATIAITAVGALTGIAGGVVAYQVAAPDHPRAVSSVVGPTAAPTQDVTRVKPCKKGWALRKGVCIRVVEVHVVDPALAPAAAPVVAATRRDDRGRDRTRDRDDDRADQPVRGGQEPGDDEADDDRDDHGEDHGEDHEDDDRDDHGDDHGEHEDD